MQKLKHKEDGLKFKITTKICLRDKKMIRKMFEVKNKLILAYSACKRKIKKDAHKRGLKEM